MTKQEQISKKIMELCLFLQKQRDPITGIIHLIENPGEIATKYKLGVGSTRKMLKLYYSFFKIEGGKNQLQPKLKGFFPNFETLNREYLYQNKLMNRKHSKNKVL
jgi:hypothetical protein